MKAQVGMQVSWDRALAWRMRQQLLDPVGTEPVEGVVRRLGAIPAHPAASAELAVRVRQAQSRAGEVAEALGDGRLIKAYAFRGATHLMTPEEGGIYLALRAASRMWELPSWQSFYGLKPPDWPLLRETVREALIDGPRTKEELGKAVSAHPKFRHLDVAFTDQSETLLKPLMWQGDMSLGPARDGRATFQRLDHNPRWPGLPEFDEAGARAIEAYFRAYGPATVENVHYWLGNGLGVRRKWIQSWMTDVADRLVSVQVDGEHAFVLREDAKGLEDVLPAQAVRLLPAYDQWVLGPGTSDAHVVPPSRRPVVSRGANILVVSGVVSGTWSVSDDTVVIDCFAEASKPAEVELAEQVARLGEFFARPLRQQCRTLRA